MDLSRELKDQIHEAKVKMSSSLGSFQKEYQSNARYDSKFDCSLCTTKSSISTCFSKIVGGNRADQGPGVRRGLGDQQ